MLDFDHFTQHVKFPTRTKHQHRSTQFGGVFAIIQTRWTVISRYLCEILRRVSVNLLLSITIKPYYYNDLANTTVLLEDTVKQ
jgi:hypothetical protein